MTAPHPKQRLPQIYPASELAQPFESENEGAMDAARVLEQQRQTSGDLPDQPPDNPVRDSRPFRNLRSR